MTAAANWSDVTRQILDGIDLAAEYRSMGLDISGKPAASGWVSCRVFGSDERSPSAGVNLTGDHPHKGRYKEFTGEGRNLSFFEFCALAGRFATWKDAREHYRKALKIKAPKSEKSAADRLAFRGFNEALVKSWAMSKPPVAYWAVRIAGGEIVGYPPDSQKFTCVALPVFGPHGVNDAPVGYVAYNKSGRDLPVFQGKGQPPRMVKIKSIEGSAAGWMNRYALANLEQAAVVWKVEGPSDMLALQSVIPEAYLRSHFVVTNSSGTLGLLSDDHLDLLAGKIINVLHDADRDGQAGAHKWAEALAYVAAEVRLVQLPYEVTESHGKDLRDWLNEGHTYDELLALAAAAPPVPRPVSAEGNGQPHRDPLAIDRMICQQLGLDVLGELPDRRIVVFSEAYGKTVQIANLNRLSKVDLLQICGEPARQYVFEGSFNDISPNQFHISRVREALGTLGGLEPVDEEMQLGQGVWRGRGEFESQLVLVGPGEAFVLEPGGAPVRVRRPRVAGLKIHLDAAKALQWYQPEQLGENLRLADDPEWCVEQVNATCKLFDNWYWENTTDVCAELMAGLILSTWVQSIWRWRPLVSITGPSDCGKTTLFETLETLFGPLSLLSSKSTEAGIRQSVANHSRVILCDEFESDRHRQGILEFFRTSSKGSKTLRGTTGQVSQAYGLRHICWVTAIELGMARAPDRNRFIAFEMAAPPKEARGRLSLPPEPQIASLGQRLLAIACRHGIAAEALSDVLKGTSIPGVHGRVVESLSIPCAMLAVVCGLDQQGAIDLMTRIFSEMETDPAQATKDEVTLLGEILSSTVRLGHGEESTVGQVLSDPTISGGLEALERVGVKVAYDNRYEIPKRIGVFFAQAPIARYLLKDTTWSTQSLSQILGRLPKAKKRQFACAGHHPWGVMVPYEYLQTQFLDDHQETQATLTPGF